MDKTIQDALPAPDRKRNVTPSILAPNETRPSTILLVDDEPDILESLSDLLSAGLENVKVLAAPSGDAALAMMKKDNVDIIVSDFKMPGMNGLQFLEKAREIAPQVPRIMMTAYPDLDLALSAINEARITKPFDPERMLGVVGDVLRNRRSKAQRDQALSRALDEARRAKGGKP